MDLIIMLIAAIGLTIFCYPYATDAEDAVTVTSTVAYNSTFVPVDIPYCDPSLCRRQKCFTYYQEVLGLWH